MNRLVEKEWITESGLKATVLMLSSGYPHRCGYVEVPEDFSTYKKNYDDIYNEIEVHGGLTYSGNVNGEDNGYWFGFDAIHHGDTPDWDAGEKMCETDEEIRTFKVLKKSSFGIMEGEVRTLDYMIAECEALATQLERIR